MIDIIEFAGFELLEVGKPYPGTISHKEAVVADMSDSGLSVYIIFNGIKEGEIKDIRSGEMQIALAVRRDIIFFLMKFGGQPWIDAPYNAHLSRNLTRLDVPGETQGYGAFITLIDSRTTIVHALRFVSLPHNFSITLWKEIMHQLDAPMDDYDRRMQSVIAAHTTKDLLAMSLVKCRAADKKD